MRRFQYQLAVLACFNDVESEHGSFYRIFLDFLVVLIVECDSSSVAYTEVENCRAVIFESHFCSGREGFLAV